MPAMKWPARHDAGWGRTLLYSATLVSFSIAWLVARDEAYALLFPVVLLVPAGVSIVFVSIGEFVASRRADERRRQGFCVRCGYSLTGNLSGVCPECGLRIQ